MERRPDVAHESESNVVNTVGQLLCESGLPKMMAHMIYKQAFSFIVVPNCLVRFMIIRGSNKDLDGSSYCADIHASA